MIFITYDRTRGELVAEGHSSAAPVGQDIVCAAVSTAMDMIAVMMPWHRLEMESRPGYERIHVKGRQARRIFDRGVMLLEGIAGQYPDQVRVVRK